MDIIYTTYFISLIVTIFITAIVSYYLWFNRKLVSGTGFLSIVSALICILNFLELSLMFTESSNTALFWFNLRFISLAFIPVFWLRFVLEFSGRIGVSNFKNLPLLYLIPLITQIIIWSNPYHHIWTIKDPAFYINGTFMLSDTSFRIPGIWLKVHLLYSYSLLFSGIIYMLYHSTKLYKWNRWQALLFDLGIFIMIIGTIFPTFNVLPWIKVSPMPQGFAIGSSLIALAIFRGDYLKKHPKIEGYKKISVSLLLLFLIMASGIIFVGYYSYSDFKKTFRTGIENQLTTVLNLKIRELTHWRRERLGDGRVLFDNRAFINLLKRYYSATGHDEAYSEIRGWIKKIKLSYDYENVFLADKSGRIIFSYPEKPSISRSHWRFYLDKAAEAKEVSFIDFHNTSDQCPLHLSIIIPVFHGKKNRYNILGFALLIINPEKYIYPMLADWPVVSKTSEIILVREENGHALFLNNTRSRPDAAMKLNISIDNLYSPSVMAAIGREGVVDGIDYNGNHVIAVMKKVPESQWYLISKINAGEAYLPVRDRFWILVIAIVGLISGTGGIISFLWRRESEKYFRNQYLSSVALLESSNRLKEAQELAHLGYWKWDIRSSDVEWSDEVYKIFDLQKDVFTPTIQSILEKSPWPEYSDAGDKLIDAATSDREPGSYEQKFVRGDGSIGYYFSTFQGDYDETGSLVSIHGTVIDITEKKLSDIALYESEKRFRSIVEGAPDPIFIQTAGKFAFLNPAALRLFGASEEKEMIGMPVMDRFHKDFHEKVKIRIKRLNIDKKSVDELLELKFIRLDSSEVWVETAGEPITYNGENGALVFVRVIQERMENILRLKESEERYRTTLDKMLEGCQIIGRDWRYIYLNDTAAFQSKLPKDRLIGKIFTEIWPGIENSETYKLIKDCLENNISRHLMNRFDYPDGSVGWFDLSIQSVPEGAFILSIDMTDRKNYEMELIRLNTELEERVRERTIELEKLNRSLESFTYSVSHDLRAPVRHISGFIDLLHKELSPGEETKEAHYIETIRNSSVKMSMLIDDLLSFSRMSRTSLSENTIDMNELLRDVVSDFSIELEKHKTVINSDNLPHVKGDKSLLRVVLVNLISNAIKFSSTRDNPVIEIGVNSAGLRTEFFVRDNGIGFDMNYYDKLFNVFQRLHSDSEFEGTGIGLAMVKNIIERHGGIIWGESIENEGTVFYFTLNQPEQ